MSTADDYAEVRQISRAFGKIARLEAILDRAATLETTIPTLEKQCAVLTEKKTGLEQEIAALIQSATTLREQTHGLDVSFAEVKRVREGQLRSELQDLERRHTQALDVRRKKHAETLAAIDQEQGAAEATLLTTLATLKEARDMLRAIAYRATQDAGS